MIGVDLFAGAGGMSLGAEQAGISVEVSVECEVNAASTYALNHPDTRIINDKIENIKNLHISKNGNSPKILFGGPPCQGFSTSNQKTRSLDNPSNWLFKDFSDYASLSNLTGLFLKT